MSETKTIWHEVHFDPDEGAWCCLPDEDTPVIWCTHDGSMYIDDYSNDADYGVVFAILEIDEVAAWAELPEPYNPD